MENTRTLLVPVDFSQASAAAFEAALVLHGQPGTTVVVLHVVDEAKVEFAIELGYGMWKDVAAKSKNHAERAMRRLTDVEPPAGVEVRRVVSVGRPVLEILRLAVELEADLIVIGSQTATAAEHAIFGSTAVRVLRAAHCPVLVIPGPAGSARIDPPQDDAPSGAASAS